MSGGVSIALTPSFIVDLETRMKIRQENAYKALNANSWWRRVAKVRPLSGRKEIVTWLVSNAMIKDAGKGGNIAYDDILSTFTAFEYGAATSGLKLKRMQLLDVDGGGIDMASKWSGDIGEYMAYWPQKQVTYILKNGHTASLVTGYDGKALFANDHPNSGISGDTSSGTFDNLLTGDASKWDVFDPAATDDVRLTRLSNIFAHVASIKQPNGEDPRRLRVTTLLVGPQNFPKATQLTQAKFLAAAAASGGGSADVQAFVNALGFAQPVMAEEFAGFESDRTFFAIAELSSDDMAPVIYGEREAFKVGYYGEMSDPDLARMQELEWQVHGYNTTAPGHPFMIFKCGA